MTKGGGVAREQKWSKDRALGDHYGKRRGQSVNQLRQKLGLQDEFHRNDDDQLSSPSTVTRGLGSLVLGKLRCITVFNLMQQLLRLVHDEHMVG